MSLHGIRSVIRRIFSFERRVQYEQVFHLGFALRTRRNGLGICLSACVSNRGDVV